MSAPEHRSSILDATREQTYRPSAPTFRTFPTSDPIVGTRRSFTVAVGRLIVEGWDEADVRGPGREWQIHIQQLPFLKPR